MAEFGQGPEGLVIGLLHPGEALTMDQVAERLPQLTWNQLFQAVDTLSRQGAIALHQRGRQYEISLSRSVAQ
jgi:DNA-binding GntR family transcriptional regulator